MGNKNIDVIEEQGDGYIRYSNGIQICWGQQLISRSNSQNDTHISYVKPFTSTPSVSLDGQSSGLFLIEWYTSEFIARVDQGDPIYITWQAIGRWK